MVISLPALHNQPTTVSACCGVSHNKALQSTVCCGITNGDIPDYKNLQWVLLALRERERFRPSSFPLKSLTTEEHDSLSIKSSSVLRTYILLSLKLFHRKTAKVFCSKQDRQQHPQQLKTICLTLCMLQQAQKMPRYRWKIWQHFQFFCRSNVISVHTLQM